VIEIPFEKIDFEAAEKKALAVLESEIPNTKRPSYRCYTARFSNAVTCIEREYEQVGKGKSDFTDKTIEDFRQLSSWKYLMQLKIKPNPSRMNQFLKFTKIELGANLSQAFGEWLNDSFEKE